jgi:alkanesulfonate monooxygenase SsuD/methylene tetrahydromethanopterin reductase-like flavin-dependent oxidoreductase (luciferase family)
MKLDYFFTMYNLGHEPYGAVLDHATEQVLVAEEAGFNCAWLGEHHFGGEGWETLPNPVLLASNLAAQTNTIRLGTAGAIITQWHPLRIAEDIAMLDHLTDGRLECGVGRGIDDRALTNLNPHDADRRNNQRNNAIFLETLDIMRKAWTEDGFRYDGEFYSFPRPGLPDPTMGWYKERNPAWRSEDGEYIGMSLVPKPLQSPHPPLWIMTDSPGGFATAAERDLKPLTWLRSRAALREALEVYQEKSAEAGKSVELGESCGLMRTCFVGETDEEARRLAEPAVDLIYRDYLGGGGRRSRNIYAEPGETIPESDLAKPWFDFLADRGHLLMGSPETVADGINEIEAEYGLETLLVWNWLPGIAHEDTMRSLRLFVDEVMPRVTSHAPPVAKGGP